MALHIVWDEGLLERTEAELIVSSRRFFSPREGQVTLTTPVGCLIHAVPPKWTEDREVLAKHLKDRYEEILYKAVQYHCSSLRLSLLGAMDERIPADMDLLIAAKCVREAEKLKELDVYLVLDNMEPGQALEILENAEGYLSQRFLEDTGMFLLSDRWEKRKVSLQTEDDQAAVEYTEESEEDTDDMDELDEAYREIQAIVEEMQRINRELGLEDEDSEPDAPGIREQNAGEFEELEEPEPPILL